MEKRLTAWCSKFHSLTTSLPIVAPKVIALPPLAFDRNLVSGDLNLWSYLRGNPRHSTFGYRQPPPQASHVNLAEGLSHFQTKKDLPLTDTQGELLHKDRPGSNAPGRVDSGVAAGAGMPTICSQAYKPMAFLTDVQHLTSRFIGLPYNDTPCCDLFIHVGLGTCFTCGCIPEVPSSCCSIHLIYRIYHIERRAIFSKLWMLSTHTSRFQKPGDYLKLELAGYSYFVILTKEGNYNVCRHRAFPLVQKETGSSTVIGCKYHGWSYSSSTGALIKAPKFNNVPSFKPSENGLFRIRTHVTSAGFIFINFAANIDNDDGVPPVPTEADMILRSDPSRIPPGQLTFEEHFGDLVSEWSNFKPWDYEYAYSWTVTGAYNWKTLMDGYQECYHCNIAHPGFAKSLSLDTYKVTPKTNFARHTADNNSKPNAIQPKGAGQDDAPPTFTFVFPACGVTVTDVMWYM
ncbi:Rieske [2Fe-2S] domain-containing protein [Rhizoctonia solani AG-1 IA]|uniref:Choline monooxygenase, chloroplastic n=1 Tax=Thanatephorus cucumeris (strain AG1-IA) TaxID=983506 RepID=L8WL23_THACA|nr:Rieske [2Fe-2S] domain-containing protein [Rhizoctonia solani AG-1 IA]